MKISTNGSRAAFEVPVEPEGWSGRFQLDAPTDDDPTVAVYDNEHVANGQIQSYTVIEDVRSALRLLFTLAADAVAGYLQDE